MKNILYFIIFFILLESAVFSQESKKDFFNIDFPQKSYNRNLFISNELITWLSIVERYEEIKENNAMTGFYFTTYIDTVTLKNVEKGIDYNEQMELDEDTYAMIDFFFSLSFKINKNFRIPVYASLIGNHNGNIEDYLHMEFGSGLIFSGGFGSISALAGYGATNYPKFPDEGFISSAQFYLIPRINLSQYPVIGFVLNTMTSHLGFSDAGIAGYSFDMISNSFMIGKYLRLSSFDLYYNNQNTFNNVKINQYGLRLKFRIKDNPLGINFDGGYRTFSTEYDPYENTFYTKTGVSFHIFETNSSAGYISLYLCFDSIFSPLPKFGCDIKLLFGESLMGMAWFFEGGVFKENKPQFTLGFRYHI